MKQFLYCAVQTVSDGIDDDEGDEYDTDDGTV